MLGSLYLKFALLVASEATERFEYRGLTGSRHPSAQDLHCKMVAMAVAHFI